MTKFLQAVFRVSRDAYTVAGVALVMIMALTVTDVILRSLGSPIVGTFELVALCGAVVIGFSIPFNSWVRGHIYVDFFVMKFPQGVRKVVHTVTRLMGLGLFGLMAWNLLKMGLDLHRSGEVSATLHVPFYPIVYGVGIACFLQSLVLFCDIVKVLRNQYE
jgi:TRAP-type C4-dicarboxylate transport system permease small subunit